MAIWRLDVSSSYNRFCEGDCGVVDNACTSNQCAEVESAEVGDGCGNGEE
jgi:hypothetical protein